MKTRDIALIAIFSAIWMALQVQFNPIVGRFFIGPFSLHGSVNRIVGRCLLTVLAERTEGFARALLEIQWLNIISIRMVS
ncbi:MAG: hypothetical protein NWE86_00295 [Candidatus Bathyarchaeota archaeon]|nr:hypothetical protein [Candidatus Bathyarchaeota archaeon]